MNDFETRNFSNDPHIDNETSNEDEANLGEISPNEANISEISEREINLYLLRYLSVHPERIRIRASERVMRWLKEQYKFLGPQWYRQHLENHSRSCSKCADLANF